MQSSCVGAFSPNRINVPLPLKEQKSEGGTKSEGLK